MKIAVRGGHTKKSTGAVALLDELKEDRKVKDAVIKYLKSLGHDILDVTPDNSLGYPAELNYGINKANNWRADLFVSIHFNKCYDSYTGPIGTEVCVFRSNEYAKRIVKGLGGLGFINRGVKLRNDLGELTGTNMTSVIVEVCFVESAGDVKLYNKLGSDAIGKNIAESIANKKVVVTTPPAVPSGPNYPPNGDVQKKGKVLASALNVRSGRGTNYPVIGTLKKGEIVDLYYCLNKWSSMESKFKDANGKAVNNFICLGDDTSKFVQIL